MDDRRHDHDMSPVAGRSAADERRDHRVVVLVADEAMQAQQDRSRDRSLRTRTRASALRTRPMRLAGFDAVPGDVADDDDDAAVGGLERVVPVAADVDVDLGGPVRGRDLRRPRASGRRSGTIVRLQQLDDAVLGFEALLARLPEPGPFERRRAPTPRSTASSTSAGPRGSGSLSPIDRTARRRPATVNGTSTHASSALPFEVVVLDRHARVMLLMVPGDPFHRVPYWERIEFYTILCRPY